MNIEIHQPELQAIIRQRMASGRFQSIEDVLIDALKDSPEMQHHSSQEPRERQNLADFLMESPLHGSGLETERLRDYPRPVEL